MLVKLPSRCFASCALFLLGLQFSLASAQEPAAPQIKVTNIRRAFHNGEHNAFTDLIRFQGRIYLTFRSCPDGHSVHPTSSIMVLESEDGRSWRTVHRFRVAQRDVRDPHFLVFNDRLFIYTGTWYCGESSPEDYGFNQHLGYAIWSRDGRDWSDPIMLEGTYGHYIWRAAAHGGKVYMCGRRKREFAETARSYREDVECVMLESDDGLVWRKHSLFQTMKGNETAFLFEPDGEVVAVARFTVDNSQLCRSEPPYSTWQRTDLHHYIGGPLLAKWGGRYLVGGRNSARPPKTTLYWLLGDRLQQLAELPSGGDNSYPGFVAHSDSRGLISWYSSHERDDSGNTITAIYLADLEIAK